MTAERRTLAGRRHGRDGFLLVEALATLAISAVILACLGLLLGLMARQADALSDRTTRLEIAERALATIAREFEATARLRWPGPGRRGFVFVGLPDRVLFAVDRADAAGQPETVAILVQSAPLAGASQVLRSESPLWPTMAGVDALDFNPPATLYQGAQAVRFAFVAPGIKGGREILRDVWSDDTALPAAIRIAFTDPETGAVSSSLRVPLRVDAEPGCAAPAKAFCSRTAADPDDVAPPNPEGR